MDTVGVIVATFGDFEFWDRLAQRAIRSIEHQTRLPEEIIRVHGSSLAEARNEGADRSRSENIIFCDADDELDPNYISAMLQGTGTLRYPMVRRIEKGVEGEPYALSGNNPLTSTYIVIGAMVERDRFLRVGGFSDLSCFEDCDLWVRCWLDGADVQLCPGAIYRWHVNPSGRNTQQETVVMWDYIKRKYTPAAQAKGLI